MNTHVTPSKKILYVAATGLFLLSACLQDPGTKSDTAQDQTAARNRAAATALMDSASVRSSHGDTVATVQAEKLRALVESGKTSGPEFDAALAGIRTALAGQDVVVIDDVKRSDSVGTLDPVVRADMDALKALVEAGKTGPELDAAIAKLEKSTGGQAVVMIDDAKRSDSVGTLDPVVRADMDALKALVEAGKTGPELDSAISKLEVSTCGSNVVQLDGGKRTDGGVDVHGGI